MTLRECYEKLGADYDGTLKRLMSEGFFKKIVEKFMEDGSLKLMEEGYCKGDGELAFRGVHTLKGLALNLGLNRLAESARLLSDKIREYDLEGSEEL